MLRIILVTWRKHFIIKSNRTLQSCYLLIPTTFHYILPSLVECNTFYCLFRAFKFITTLQKVHFRLQLTTFKKGNNIKVNCIISPSNVRLMIFYVKPRQRCSRKMLFPEQITYICYLCVTWEKYKLSCNCYENENGDYAGEALQKERI